MPSDYYNRIYKSSQEYKKEPEDLKYYYQSWKFCSDMVKNNKIKLILDIGCGPGHLPKVLNKHNNNFKYIGFDFSQVAINNASQIKNDHILFYTQDALKINYNNYINNYDKDDILISSFEFLEHVTKDVEIIKKMPKYVNFCFSVPNYDSEGHVRIYRSKLDIYKRYNKFLNIYGIIENKFSNGNIIYIFWGKIAN